MMYCIDGDLMCSDYFHIVERYDEACYVTHQWVFPTYQLAKAFMDKCVADNPSAGDYDYFTLFYHKVKINSPSKKRKCLQR